MRRLPLVIVAIAALMSPAVALAKAPQPPTDRSFEIRGLVQGDRTIDASGKLAIQGTSLIASVGCNTIGGTVDVEGDQVTILKPLVQTEMACPGVEGSVEAALVQILQDGPFTITADAWVGSSGQILTLELPGGQPDASPPDQPGDAVTEPPVPIGSCPPIGGTNGSTSVDSGPGAASGTAGSGGGSAAGSGGGDGGGAGSAPAGTPVAVPGGPAETGAEEPPVVAPLPPQPAPEASGTTVTTNPGGVLVSPPGPPAAGSPMPVEPNRGVLPSDPCLGMSFGVDHLTGNAIPPKAGDGTSGGEAASADQVGRDSIFAGTPSWIVGGGVILAVFAPLGAAFLLMRRRPATRP